MKLPLNYRRTNLKLTVLISCLHILFLTATSLCLGQQPNVLFIAIDDLRPELGCYGSPIAVTPNIDALASNGLMFNRAYCQQAICRPSRASLMTGTRPETTGLFHNYVALRDLKPDIITLPQHFIANGYETVYCGKVFHRGDTDEENSWSRKPAKVNLKKPVNYALPENVELRKQNLKKMLAKYGPAAKFGLGSGPAYESADVSDETYADGYQTARAIATLKELVVNKEKPFFLALGFKLPHLNWVAPKKYWDLYDRKNLPLAEQTAAPKNGAAMGLHASFELRTRAGIPKIGPIDDQLSRTLKHAYLASVSYVDAQLGKMIAALEETGQRDNTIIVLWSDHGWHLGEMGVWGKATNYEVGTRVPLIMWTPKMKVRGKKTNALVELVDIFPTLCELANLQAPDHLEGTSFMPLLDAPDQKWKDAAYSQFPNPALREWAANPLSPGMRETFFGPLIKQVEARIESQMTDRWDRELFENHLMGYSMRTDRFRLVQWSDQRDRSAEPLFTELFDHESDPSETVNVANQYPDVVESMTAQLLKKLRPAR